MKQNRPQIKVTLTRTTPLIGDDGYRVTRIDGAVIIAAGNGLSVRAGDSLTEQQAAHLADLRTVHVVTLAPTTN